MGDDDDRRLGPFPESEELDVEALPGQGVERAERLVEEEDRRVEGERPGQRDPLAHPAREMVGSGAGEPVETDQLEQLVAACLARLAGAAGQLERVGDVVELSRQGRSRGSWNTKPTAGSGPTTGRPSTSTIPAVRGQQPADDPQQGALAAPVRADDRDDLAPADLEVEAVEGDEALAVGVANVRRTPDRRIAGEVTGPTRRSPGRPGQRAAATGSGAGRPASDASRAALSVRSQGRSRSGRPKWP